MSEISKTLEELNETNEAAENTPGFNEQGSDLVETMARALVDHPASVKVNVVSGNQMTMFELSVDKTDLGKIIGKQGKTAGALRRVVWGFAAKHKRNAVLEVIE